MIDFLKKYGISDEVVKEMIKINSSANIYNFSCNQDEIVKMIDFLRSIGVTCIEQLLIYRIDIFFVSFDEFKNLFVKQDLGSFVNEINADYTMID